MSLKIQSTSAPVGAIVTDLDLSDLSQEDKSHLYQAFLEHGVLVFKGMHLDHAGLLALSAVFGEPELHPIEDLRLEDEPKLIMLAANGGKPIAVDDPDADTVIGRIPWHMDLIYTEVPNRGALLRAVTIPDEGGQTGWIDTAGLYRALPYEIKLKLQGLQVVHSYENTHRLQNMVGGSPNLFQDILHPLVYVHPENDLPVLNISPSTIVKIVGLPDEEADALLKYLVEFATREDRAYVHQWEPGDVVLWDNWRTIHRAYGHPKRHPRIVHRSTLKSNMRLGRRLSDASPAQQAAE